jgi:hypothetical protein
MTNSRTRSSLVVGISVGLMVALGGCSDPSPTDRVLESLDKSNPARSVDAAAIDDYAPRICAAMRAAPEFSIATFSRFVASAPPGTLPELPIQGLTDSQLIELNRAVATEYCPDVLGQGEN